MRDAKDGCQSCWTPCDSLNGENHMAPIWSRLGTFLLEQPLHWAMDNMLCSQRTKDMDNLGGRFWFYWDIWIWVGCQTIHVVNQHAAHTGLAHILVSFWPIYNIPQQHGCAPPQRKGEFAVGFPLKPQTKGVPTPRKSHPNVA